MLLAWLRWPNAPELRSVQVPEGLPEGTCLPPTMLGSMNRVSSIQFSRSLVSDSVTPWTAAHQASLFINSQSLLKFMSIESVMPSNHLILCCPLLLLPSIFPSIRVYSSESALHQVAKELEFQLQHQSFQ